MTDEPTPTDHGLTVEKVPRPDPAIPAIPAGTEPCDTGAPTTLVSDLRDLQEIPLAQVAAAVKAGDIALEDTLRRIAPHDGRRVLLVAAAFNSAI